MLKVSFKETDKNPSRVVSKFGRSTTVVLRGTVRLPEFWKHVPEKITDWIACQESVEVYENMADNTLIVFSEGRSKCHADDRYDSILGERIAEARAKSRMYHFFYKLASRLCDYYSTLLFGETVVSDSCSGNCLMQEALKYQRLCMNEGLHIIKLLADGNDDAE